MGTARIAYVHAVANQVHTRLVPPAAKAGSTTPPGSRRMSGQSNVEDNTVAAAANATAPSRNSPPVVRRRPVFATADVKLIVNLFWTPYSIWTLYKYCTLCSKSQERNGHV